MRLNQCAPLLSDPYADYPQGWARYNKLAKRNSEYGKIPGFEGPIADINRFGHRFRAARVFSKAEFDSGSGSPMTSKTAAGYSALIRHFLAHSVCEEYRRVRGLKIEFSLDEVAHKQGTLKCLRKHCAQSIFRHVAEITDTGFQQRKACLEAKKYVDGAPPNYWWLSAALRNMFAHGRLTPNNKAVAIDSSAIANAFTDLLLESVSLDFLAAIQLAKEDK